MDTLELACMKVGEVVVGVELSRRLEVGVGGGGLGSVEVDGG